MVLTERCSTARQALSARSDRRSVASASWHGAAHDEPDRLVANGPLVLDKWGRAGSSKTVVAFNVALLPVTWTSHLRPTAHGCNTCLL
jgi:hypothetical protein